ncbi:MAG TPA: sugar ABC transporter substrate-binding protein [Spirochaetia bacterium]|nr:sugar ABC transporter substrate-binding protein [Spirochaetia bacterium]
MNKRIAAILFLALALSAGAFGQKKVDLKIAWWGSQVRHEATIKVIELYQKLNPNVSITYEFAGFDDYWTKMTTMAAGGQLPDVMQQDYSRIAEWQKRGLLEPLDPFVADRTLKLGGVAKPVLDSGTLDKKLYALSLGSNSYCMMLDVDAFKKAGVPLPAQDWTWADLERIAMQLHAKLGIWGVGGGFEVDELAWKANYLGLGQTMYTPDGKALAYKDDKALVDFLHMMLRLVKAGAAPSYQEYLANLGGATGNVQLDAIVTGKSAIEAVWSNQVITVATAAGAGRNFAVVHLPRHKKGGMASNFMKPSMFFSVTSQSKNKAEAAKFIDFWTNDVEANKILNAERGVPVDASVRAALKEIVSPVVKLGFEYIDRVAKDAAPTPPPEPAGHANIRQNVYVPIIREQVFYGVISPEEAAKQLREKAAAILAGK